VDEIRPFPGQPRDWFDPKTMEELAASISSAGQQVPITVTRVKQIGKDGIRFELIDGERRLRATKKLGFRTIKAMVKTVTDIEQQFENSVIVNFNRDGHSPIETARAIKRLKANGQSTEMIAKKLGRSVPWAHQHLNILKLNPTVIEMMHPALPESGGTCPKVCRADSGRRAKDIIKKKSCPKEQKPWKKIIPRLFLLQANIPQDILCDIYIIT